MLAIRRLLLLTTALPALTLLTPAAGPPSPSLPADLALVPADADGVVSARVAKLWAGDSFRSYREQVSPHKAEMAELFGLLPEEFDRLTAFSRGDDTVLLVTTKEVEPTDRKKVLAAFASGAERRTIAGKPCYRNEEDWLGVAFLTDRVFALGRVDAVEAFVRSGPVREGPHAETLRLAARHDLVVGATPAGACGLEALAGRLPKAAQGAAPLLKATFAVLTVQEQRGSGRADGPSQLSVTATFRYTSAEAAGSGARAATTLAQVAAARLGQLEADWKENGCDLSENLHGVVDAVTELHGGSRRLDVSRRDDTITLRLAVKAREVGTLAASQLFFNTYTHKLTGPGQDPHLQQLAKAVLAYHKDNGRLPPHALHAKDGKTPLLSWRVLVLPYLGDEGKKLHGRFRLDEPWDSEHNIRLVRQMPRVFAGVDGPVNGTTEYQVLVGSGTLFDGPKGRKLSDATDGAANTVLIAQAYHKVPWTKPQDLPYAADRPLPRMGGRFGGFGHLVNLAFADGQVSSHAAPGGAKWTGGKPVWEDVKGFNDADLRALITRAGGEKAHREGSGQPPSAGGHPAGSP